MIKREHSEVVLIKPRTTEPLNQSLQCIQNCFRLTTEPFQLILSHNVYCDLCIQGHNTVQRCWEFKGTVGAGVFLSVEALSFSVISPSLGVSA